MMTAPMSQQFTALVNKFADSYRLQVLAYSSAIRLSHLCQNCMKPAPVWFSISDLEARGSELRAWACQYSSFG